MSTKIFGINPDAPPDLLTGHFGDSTNYVGIDHDGVISLYGNAQGIIYTMPTLEFHILKQTTKPTLVSLGVFNGYSMPIYNSDNEELLFRMRVPPEWNGTTNPYVKMIVYLSGAEDVGDKFKFQLDWMNASITGTVTDAVVNTYSEITILEGRAAQNSCYMITFEIDLDAPASLSPVRPNLINGDNLNGRLRRIAASSSDVTNEIIVNDWIAEWQCSRLLAANFTV